MNEDVSVDLIILGGGIAGLWTLNRAVQSGYNAILFEQQELGCGQTIHSQGIIHGGLKYTFGQNSGTYNSIKGMPELWRACLKGGGQIDLSKTDVLSESQYLWTPKTLRGGLSSFISGKLLHSGVSNLSNNERPLAFQDKNFEGNLFKLNEPVVDVPSLIAGLVQPVKDRIFKLSSDDYLFVEEGDSVSGVHLHKQNFSIGARRIAITCGEGVASIGKRFAELPAMQLRPLHMVMVKHNSNFPLFTHYFDGAAKPSVTITTHTTQEGDLVWYLGGDLAEKGVNLGSTAQILVAQSKLRELLPWIKLHHPRWQTLRVNRAEPAQKFHNLPDTAYAKRKGNLIVGWPTKLALAPVLAEKILDMMPAAEGGEVHEILKTLPQPEVVKPVWEGTLWS